MTDPDPSPFRRFPWIQLVFCIACLSMAAWTWMGKTRTVFTTEITERTEENVRHAPMFSVTFVPSVVR